MNTHLDHEGSEARVLGLETVIAKAESARLFPDAPVLLCGDFNADLEDMSLPEAAVMAAHREYRNLVNGMGPTFHDFGKTAANIDFIYYKAAVGSGPLYGDLIVTDREKWTDCKDGVWLSDHYPVCVTLRWDS
ncbi:MAG: endonuclease/exonuclease/phosphatase family protein [Lachnospiraceae bacterium]|nr:endonuclease/exonuclease/phosphatase family protein [Lachnospiraceae bacterium]